MADRSAATASVKSSLRMAFGSHGHTGPTRTLPPDLLLTRNRGDFQIDGSGSGTSPVVNAKPQFRALAGRRASARPWRASGKFGLAATAAAENTTRSRSFSEYAANVRQIS